jgi:hypothetical protein
MSSLRRLLQRSHFVQDTTESEVRSHGAMRSLSLRKHRVCRARYRALLLDKSSLPTFHHRSASPIGETMGCFCLSSAPGTLCREAAQLDPNKGYIDGKFANSQARCFVHLSTSIVAVQRASPRLMSSNNGPNSKSNIGPNSARFETANASTCVNCIGLMENGAAG